MANDASSTHPLRRYIAPAIITAFILIAIVIGLAPRGPKGNFIQSSEFQLAMDRAPMGQPQPLPGRMTVIPTNTFRDRQQRWCRSFGLKGAIEGSGIVCRQEGEWLIEGRANSESSANLRTTFQRLGGFDPLLVDDEQKVIDSRWAY